MPDTNQNRLEEARGFIAALPYCGVLRLDVEEVGEGEVTILMPYHEDLIGDPATGVVHGGAVTALMDTCSGAAVMSHPQAGLNTATLDLRIDYMRAAVPGQTIRARAVCTRVTRSIAFVHATAFDDDSGDPIATAAGAFTVAASGEVA